MIHRKREGERKAEGETVRGGEKEEGDQKDGEIERSDGERDPQKGLFTRNTVGCEVII